MYKKEKYFTMIDLSDFQHPFLLKYHEIQFQITVPNADEEAETKKI